MDERDLEPDHGLRPRIAWLLSAHCYALDLAARLKRMGQPAYQRDGDPRTSGPGFGVTLHPDKLDVPLHWRKPRMVFVNSMSDLFHEDIPAEFIFRVFQTMAKAHWHTFQVLTKRSERMEELLRIRHPEWPEWTKQPLPNVWLGTSIENRRFVHRADLLRETPAAVRFVSAEPLLGPLVASTYVPEFGTYGVDHGGECVWPDGQSTIAAPELDLTGIDWLICGGESGPKHRRFDLAWARDLRDACRDTGTAYFVKQLGGNKPGSKLEDLPEDLRIREMPKVGAAA